MSRWPDAPPDNCEGDLSGHAWVSRDDTAGSLHKSQGVEGKLAAFAAIEQDRYERRQVLGLGGMGKVTCVFDRRLKRPVALKELRPKAGGSGELQEGLERLAREVWVTANLEHPGIVPVYDAGLSDDDRLYYTMRLIRGRSLFDALVAGPAPGRRGRLLRTFLRACEAVAYAHSRGIIHRDLKPTNIMVGEFGETQVVDWGLARRVEAPTNPCEDTNAPAHANDPDDQGLTMAGSIVGTPAYMSPEQASGAMVDARADVWSLGAVLFEVVTGRPAMSGSGSELLFKLKAANFQFAAEVSDDEVPSELMAVILRAMTTDPERRYANAGELATDLTRFLDGRQVSAYDYSGWELLTRLARRWKVPLAVGLTMLVVAIFVGVWGYSSTVAERDRAVAAETEARSAERVSKRAEGEARRAQQAATASRTRANRNLARALIGRALEAQRVGAHPEAETFAVGALKFGDSPDARGVLAALEGTQRPRWLWRREAPDPCPSPRLNADATLVACLHATSLELWELGTTPKRRWETPYKPKTAVFLSGDDLMVTTANQEAIVLDSATGRVLKKFDHFKALHLSVSRSRRYVVGTHHQHKTLVDTRTWQRHDATFPYNLLQRSAFTPDEKFLLAGRESGWIGRAPLDGDYQRLVKIPFKSDVRALSLSHDQKHLMLASLNGDVSLQEISSGEQLWHRTVSARPVVQAAFCPTGELLAVAGERGGIVVLQARTGQPVTVFPARWSRRFVWISSRELISLGRGRLVRWQIAASTTRMSDEQPHGLSNATISRDERWLAVSDGGGRFRIFSAESGSHVKTIRWQHRVGRYSAFTRDNRFLVTAAMSEPPHVRAFEVGTWRRVPAMDAAPMVRRILPLRESRVILAQYTPNFQLVWDAASPDDSLKAIAGPYRFVDIGVDESGRRAALLDADKGVVAIYDDEHRSLTEAFAQPKAMSAIDISLNRTIAIGAERGIELRSIDGAHLHRFDGDGFELMDVAFGSGGDILAASYKNGLVRFWDTASGKLLARLSSGTQRVPTIEFSNSGTWLVTSSWDGRWRRYGVDTLTATIPSLAERVSLGWGLSLDDLLSDSGL